MSEYMMPFGAYQHYELTPRPENPKSEIEQALEQAGIAAIEMPLHPNEFDHLSQSFEIALDECPEPLRATLHQVDSRYGSEAGYTRKNKKIDPATGLQLGDGKNYFHFTEAAYPRWKEQFTNGPQVLKDFIADGYEIHNALIATAKNVVSELKSTHPNMPELYFPKGSSTTYLRVLRYDGYWSDEAAGEVAKPHYDIGGLTLQAYADAPGFWGAKDGVNGPKQHHDTASGQGYAFMGKGHERVYGKSDAIRPLWHGVDRIVPAGVTYIPERSAVILFVNAPKVDYLMRQTDTLPQLRQAVGKKALVGV